MENFNTCHYVAANKNNDVLKESSSGGIFTALAEVIFEAGGEVFGAAFDAEKYEVRHRAAENLKQLSGLRKSKYVWSDWTECVPDIKNALEKGRSVLFSGTPCQAAAIRQKFGHYDKLYIMDLFCHGTADSFYFKQYLELFGERVTGIDFRGQAETQKQNFQFRIWQKDRLVLDDTYDNNLFTRLYTSSAALRVPCFSCRFSHSSHSADITLGDFDYTETAEQLGITALHPSIVAVNSEKGQLLWEGVADKVIAFPILEEAQIAHYYRGHDRTGDWGYNPELRAEFIKNIKEMGFMRAAYASVYPKEMKLIEKMEVYLEEDKVCSLYGCGKIGIRVLRIIRHLHPDWTVREFIVSKKAGQPDSIEGVPIKEIDEIQDLLYDHPVAITVSEKNAGDVQNELKKREILNYFY